MKNKIFAIIITMLISVSLSHLYSNVVLPHSRERLKTFTEKVYLEENRAGQDFELLKDTWLLKIKYTAPKTENGKIFVNGLQQISNIFPYTKRRKDNIMMYIYLPEEIIRQGKNSTEIIFPSTYPSNVILTLSNYRKKFGEDIFVLFSDSAISSFAGSSFKTIFLFIVIIFLFFGVMNYFLNRVFQLDKNKIFLYHVYSLLPLLVFLSCLWAINNLSGFYKIAISPYLFWNFGLLTFFITEGCIVLRKAPLSSKKEEILSTNLQIRKFASKTVNWISSREFSDKCIILFMFLLVMSMFFLIFHLSSVAGQFADIAYFALAIGVIIKLVKLVRKSRD